MAIYHLETKVITRSFGRSACAAAAYMSCSRIYNDYDGIQHDYTRKRGLCWEQVFLPVHAPPAWQDRSVLWNAVEEAEKAKDSRLAREFVVALPAELYRDAWIDLLTKFISSQFVHEGMCVDAAIHDTDGHNPHAHIMLTVRPLDEQGRMGGCGQPGAGAARYRRAHRSPQLRRPWAGRATNHPRGIHRKVSGEAGRCLRPLRDQPADPC